MNVVEESNLVRHAREEMRRAGLYDEDSDYGGMIPEAVMGIVERFANQGHSGGSAAVVLAVLDKVLRFEPLTPLTNDSDEWIDRTKESGGTPMWQSRRQSGAFSTDGGHTYYTLDDPNVIRYTTQRRG